MIVLSTVTYGSKLYGTNTPTSDTDLKVVYLPDLSDLIMLRKPKIFKNRFDANNNNITDPTTPMPDNGVEVEYFPLQTFAMDFVAGQTYAVEMVYAIINGPEDVSQITPFGATTGFKVFCEMMAEQFSNREVYSMVGFAAKQTMDYVTRGERLNDAKAVRDAIYAAYDMCAEKDLEKIRLDRELGTGVTVLDFVSMTSNLKIGSSENNNKMIRTLELNGRSYLETSSLAHVLRAVDKLITGYGERSTRAAESSVDFKSLSHAVRVYEQAIELLDTGSLTFPRPNAADLLAIKRGKADLDAVKDRLRTLDNEVREKMLTSTVRERTPELLEQFDKWLLANLQSLYEGY